MFYQTTEAHEALRAKIREFAETEVKPVAFLLDQENRFPTEAVRKLGELGLMGIPYEKKYGGAELDTLSSPHRGAQAEISARPVHRPQDRRLRPDGA